MTFTTLIVMVSGMFVGTLLVGHVPLLFRLSPTALKSFSIFGANLILGAGLSIVIPEGIEAVYDSSDQDDHHKSTYTAVSLLLGFLFMYLVDEMQSHAHTHEKPSRHSHHDKSDLPARSMLRKRSGAYTLPRRISGYNGIDCHHLEATSSPSQDRRLSRENNEQRGSYFPSAATPSVNGDSTVETYVDIEDEEALAETDPLNSNRGGEENKPSMARRQSNAPSVHGGKGTKSISTTIGLIVHSLADGISLGASSSAALKSEGMSLDVIVFLAIIVHKAPAAFGLTSVLLGDGWSRMKIRQALIMFSLAAPVGAIATYFVLLAVSHARDQSPEHIQSLQWFTGLALLFSGGTFLFVAFHVMQEQNPSVRSEDEAEESGRDKFKRVSISVAGMISPFCLRLLAGHGH